MNETQSNPSCADDELDLRELFSVLWKGKSIIALFTGLAAFLSLTVALSIPNSYQSTALLAPKSHGGAGSLSRLASQYGGLASLAGMNLGGLDGDGMSKSALALEKMRSFAFFEQYVYEDLLLEIMAVNHGMRVQGNSNLIVRFTTRTWGLGYEKLILRANLNRAPKKLLRSSKSTYRSQKTNRQA